MNLNYKKHRYTIIAVILICIDQLQKIWTFKNLRVGEYKLWLGDSIGILHTQNVGFTEWHFYYRLLWLAVFTYLFIRTFIVDMSSGMRFGITFTFFGILGNYIDPFVFTYFFDAEDFIQRTFTGISLRSINTIYVNFGPFNFGESISGFMSTIGLLTIIVVIVSRFLRRLFPQSKPA